MGGIAADETFDGTFPFTAHYTSAPGFRMHYVDEGSGEPIILIHGEPTWAYLYRNFIPQLSRRFRVIAPDNMGFGKSETPPDADYTLDRHARNLGRLIEELDLRDITLVMQDWGGPMGAVVASRYPDRMKRFVAMNTIFGTDRNVREGRLTPWFTAIKEMEESDHLEAVLGNLRYLVGGIMMTLGIERREIVTDTWLRAYAAAFPTLQELPRRNRLSAGGSAPGANPGHVDRGPAGAVQAGPGRGAGDDDRGYAGPCDLATCRDRGLPRVLSRRDRARTGAGGALHTRRRA